MRVGTIASTHGIRGEVKVFPTTDDPMRFKKLKKCVLDTGREHIELEVAGVKFFKQFAILKFKGIDNINDIEKYRGKDLLVDRQNAVPLEEDEYFIVDLIGLRVVTDKGEEFGQISDVLQTGANDVLEIDAHDGKSYLFPMTKECVPDINLESGIVTVHVLPGLLDL